MKRGWLTGGSILLAALIAASPAMGEGWYGAFKPFFYASDLSHFGKNPLPARSAGPLTEGAMSAVNNPSDAVSIAGAELTLGRRLDESSSAELTLHPSLPLSGLQNRYPPCLTAISLRQ